MLADIRRRILVCIHTSIRALFMILGWPEPSRRALAVALDKFSDRALSHRRVQLGLMFDTRTLTVSLPEEKRELLLALLEVERSGIADSPAEVVHALQAHGGSVPKTSATYAAIVDEMSALRRDFGSRRYTVFYVELPFVVDEEPYDLVETISIPLRIQRPRVY